MKPDVMEGELTEDFVKEIVAVRKLHNNVVYTKTGLSLTLFDKINQGKDLEKTSNNIIFLGISFVNFMPCKHDHKGSHSGLLPSQDG